MATDLDMRLDGVEQAFRPWHQGHADNWSVDHETARITTYVGIKDERGVTVAIVVQANGDDRIEELAALITTAPELLAAAEMLASLEQDRKGRSFPTAEQCAFARRAVAKATGGSL